MGGGTTLPSGTVTFLFTDIEGSTRLLQDLGDAYEEALSEHRELLRTAFASHGGHEIGTEATRSSSPSPGPATASPQRSMARSR